MERKFLNYFWIFLKGMAMGIADLIPGVSGGTIAFITGIYEELISSLNEIKFSLIKDLKNGGIKLVSSKINIPFLICLFSGIILSVLLFSNFISWLLIEHPIQIWSFFFGLIISSIFYVIKKIEKWNFLTALMLIIGIIIAYRITKLEVLSSYDSYIYLFISGAIAICAMILPGISGAFILVIMGSYGSVLQAINDKEIYKIMAFGLGAIFGLMTFSKLLKFLFKEFKNETLAILIGFMAGALVKIWPWKKNTEKLLEECVSPLAYEGDPKLFQAINLILIGFLLIFIFDYLANKKVIE